MQWLRDLRGRCWSSQPIAGTAAPRSPLEATLGDGAAAFVIADHDVAVTVQTPGHAVANEMLDVWRGADEPFVSSWEQRFVVKHGARDVAIEAIAGLCERIGTPASEFDHVVFYAPDPRTHGALVAGAGAFGRASAKTPCLAHWATPGPHLR